MLSGVHGSLLSMSFLESVLPAAFGGRLGEASRGLARRRLKAWWRRSSNVLGPASSIRALLDHAAGPLTSELGFRLGAVTGDAHTRLSVATLAAPYGATVSLIVTSWDEPLDGVWRDAVRHGIRTGSRWCFCFNGPRLRVVDAERTYARRFLEFDIEIALDDESGFGVLWGLLRGEAFDRMASDPPDRERLPMFDQAVAASDRHASAVCHSLQHSVREALEELLHAFVARRSRPRARNAVPEILASGFEQSLTIIYRVLFLLFAEARRLVPIWHPIYRDSYTIESLRHAVEGPDRAAGLWGTLQAIARLAHAGCQAGDLQVTPFNGRLFAPAWTPMGEDPAVEDEAIRRVLLALTTRVAPGGAGRERIAYGDLGVEQLGAVYERVLDYTPRIDAVPLLEPGQSTELTEPIRLSGSSAPPIRVRLHAGGGRRKATGTFYTPRSVTEFLVRRTLHPLIDGASPAGILNLRILDPSMGSGAFLVCACRYLAAAYESAKVQSGECLPEDVSEEDRAAFRRTVAQRCLFGVDLNPMAVQLARLSLWLATLAADRPLTFLDHHLRAGDSLVGASLEDLARQPPPGSGRAHAHAAQALPLFRAVDLTTALRAIVTPRSRVAIEPGDTLAAVREKEQTLEHLAAPGSPLSRWKDVAGLWCACWFWESGQPPGAGAFAELMDALLHDRSTLADGMVAERLEQARRIAGERAFFHWRLEFPEVFFADDGQPLENPGFDAVVGNPPWDMLRADQPGQRDMPETRARVAALVRFAHDSGTYTAQSSGHPNSYQLFLDRAVSLLKRGGRLGMLVPSGLALDHGCAGLRRLLLERCDTDTLVGFDNRSAIFPIHRSVKFLLVTSTSGRPTSKLRCRFGDRDASGLDAIPDDQRETPTDTFPVVLTPSFIRRVSGEALTIPELRHQTDLTILDGIIARVPVLSEPDGWGARFGRELNATDDRAHFVALPAARSSAPAPLPVVEGKQIEPFVVDLAASRFGVPRATAARLDRRSSFDRPRLAYRDVASSSNRLTLIAAVIPSGTVTTHTLFCLKTALDRAEQLVLCAVLNSYVANYLVRQRVTTHVTAATLERLPAPRPLGDSPVFRELASLADRLSHRPAARAALNARLQALTAALYGLSVPEFSHVLATFPLIEDTEKQAALDEFRQLSGSSHRGTL